MSQALITIRRALPGDAEQIAAVHDGAWREAYRGLIPGRELERLIARRGPDWWRRAVAQGSRLLVLSLHGTIGGYVSYGRNRAPSMDFDGEIFELYLAPEYQGMGFGARLFKAARHDLAAADRRSQTPDPVHDDDARGQCAHGPVSWHGCWHGRAGTWAN